MLLIEFHGRPYLYSLLAESSLQGDKVYVKSAVIIACNSPALKGEPKAGDVGDADQNIPLLSR